MFCSKANCCCMRVDSWEEAARWEEVGPLSWSAKARGRTNRRIERKVISVPFIFI